MQLGLLDARETVWVDGVIVYDTTSMQLANEIPVMIGSKRGVLKVTTGWHLMGGVRLLVDGEVIDPAPKGTALPDVPHAEAKPKSSIVRLPVLLPGIVAGVSAGLIPLVMKAGPVARLIVLGIAAILLVAIVAVGRARQRRQEK